MYKKDIYTLYVLATCYGKTFSLYIHRRLIDKYTEKQQKKIVFEREFPNVVERITKDLY